MSKNVRCARCEGKRAIAGKPCPRCDGSGFMHIYGVVFSERPDYHDSHAEFDLDEWYRLNNGKRRTRVNSGGVGSPVRASLR